MSILNKNEPPEIVKPVCSVCIANFNGIEVLPECIESIYSQSNKNINFEIIIHDDASTDSSVEMILKNYPEVTLLASDKNVGFCESNNRMVRVASGDYIFLLNNDAVLFQNSIESLYERAVAQVRKGILTLPQYDRAKRENIDFGNDLDLFLNPVPREKFSKVQVSTVHGACLWMPKELWCELGGFPIWFESIGEDMYLCLYALCLGYPVEVIENSGFWHWVGSSFGGGKVQNGQLITSYKRRYLSERNKTYLMILFYPVVGFIVLTFHVLLLSVEGVVLSILKRDFGIWTKIYGKALSDVFKNLTFVMRMRRDMSNRSRLDRFSIFRVILWRPRKLQLLMRHGLPKIS